MPQKGNRSDKFEVEEVYPNPLTNKTWFEESIWDLLDWFDESKPTKDFKKIMSYGNLLNSKCQID